MKSETLTRAEQKNNVDFATSSVMIDVTGTFSTELSEFEIAEETNDLLLERIINSPLAAKSKDDDFDDDDDDDFDDDDFDSDDDFDDDDFEDFDMPKSKPGGGKKKPKDDDDFEIEEDFDDLDNFDDDDDDDDDF